MVITKNEKGNIFSFYCTVCLIWTMACSRFQLFCVLDYKFYK